MCLENKNEGVLVCSFCGLFKFDFWFNKNKYIHQGYINVLNASKILLNLINNPFKSSKNKKKPKLFGQLFLKKTPLLLVNFVI